MRADMNLCKYGKYNRYILNGNITIIKLIGYGTSVFVYEAMYNEKRFILKELFPEGLNEKSVIKRDKYGKTIHMLNIASEWEWQKAKFRFLLSVYRNRKLQRLLWGKRYIQWNIGVMHTNGTIYALYKNENGIAWSCCIGESLENIIIRCSKIADIIHEIHKLGWLLIDVKSSNFIIVCTKKREFVEVVDFDSMVMIPFFVNNFKKKFYCSSDTAAPELIAGNVGQVGIASDIYSIAAMLFKKITGISYNKCKDINLLLPFISTLSKEKSKYFYELLKTALHQDVIKRKLNAADFSRKLLRVLR